MIFSLPPQTLHYTRGATLTVADHVAVHRGVTALTGPNGAGKTLLGRILENGRDIRTNRIKAHLPQPKVSYMEFNDVHSWTGTSVEYYQQRYETSMNDAVPTVEQALGQRALTPQFARLATLFNLDNPLHKKVNHLSSGELRKVLIINALLNRPDLLILDNPYIGLDHPSRLALHQTIAALPAAGTSVMLLEANPANLPPCVDHRLYVRDLTLRATPPPEAPPSPSPLFPFAPAGPQPLAGPMVELKNCTVSYGRRTLIDRIDWTIYPSERWHLSGPNGSGKSTLLSLICADNPKSYALDITLFGRRRGTGESIWDIKRLIGYVSAEMQLHFHTAAPLLHVVASGLNDTRGLFVKPTAHQLREALDWLRHFSIDSLAHTPMARLSAGQRQLALVARSLIKQPRLLVLDEPMHALDPDATQRVKTTVESFARARPDAALIFVGHNPSEIPVSITHQLTLPHHAS